MAISRELLPKGKNIKMNFLRKIYNHSKAFQKIQKNYDEKVNTIAQEYVQKACKYQVGNSIAFKNSTNGFHGFKIEKIIPDINWSTNIVRFKAVGEFYALDKEPEKGMLFLDDLKPIEQGKQETTF